MSKVTLIDRRGTSVDAAKDLVVEFSKQETAGRKVCLIGDMETLVTENVPTYRGLGEAAAALGLGMIITVGPIAVEVFDGTRQHREAGSIYFNSKPGFMKMIPNYIREGDTVLFISGNDYDEVYDALAAL